MERMPLETQTLYAEFMEQLAAFEARRTIGKLPGTFTRKKIKGETYLYFQYSGPGSTRKQLYLGRESPLLRKAVERFREERDFLEPDRQGIARLCALLRAGGALVTDSSSGRVLRTLSEAGVFYLNGVLVGTNAFIVLGNLLGVRWDRAALRTLDIDIAGTLTMQVALPDVRAGIPEALESLEMGFLPVPSFNPKDPSTSFKVRGQPLRVDLLTPMKKGSTEGVVQLARFKAAANCLPYLDFLIEDFIKGAVVDGGGVLVNVPAPERFAFHKLATAEMRGVTEQTKAEKDLLQAAQVLEILLEERPQDVRMALEEVEKRGRNWVRMVQAGVRKLEKRFPGLDLTTLTFRG